ncbi:MAG: hypothetical protein ACPGVB_01105 [Chitinophagales bacterium]
MTKHSFLHLLVIFLIICFCISCKNPKRVSEGTDSTSNPTTGNSTKLPTIKESLSPTIDYWQYSPLHPDNHAPVTYSVKAYDDKGIEKVTLGVYEFELYKNEADLPSKRRRENGQWGIVKTWLFSPEKDTIELNFSTKGFPAHTNVFYQFKVTNAQGHTSEKQALFDAGDSPWEEDKILLYSTTDTIAVRNRINICFLIDADYHQDWRKYLGDVEHLIFNGYHANNMIEAHKEKWIFYYTHYEASADLIINTDIPMPSIVTTNPLQGIDAYALLHQEDITDGAFIAERTNIVTHSFFTAEPYNMGTVVHETAHAIFNLNDEYSGAPYEQLEVHSNAFESKLLCEQYKRDNDYKTEFCRPITDSKGKVWFTPEDQTLFTSRSDCEDYNRANQFDIKDCTALLIQDTIWYRPNPSVCIMLDDRDTEVPDFQEVCKQRIEWYYEQLGK